MNRKALIVADNFPPNGVTSSRRPGEMAKYLPDFGWTPIVITSQWRPNNCNYDPNIVPYLQSDLIRYEANSVKPRGARAVLEQIVRVFQPQKHPYSLLESTRKTIEYVIQNEKIDVIWVTVPPFNLLQAASTAAIQKNIPWIADFRDAWQFIPNQFVRITIAQRLKYERQMVKSAAAITTVSAGLADTLQKRHNRAVYTIPHGFDADLLLEKKDNCIQIFNIVFTGGVLLGKPNFRPLLDALGRLIEKGKINEKEIRVDFFGAGNTAALKKMFSNHPYARLVQNHGPVPRLQAIEKQRSAAVLLAAGHPGAKGVITSKIFEYITSGRPILSIPKDNDCIDELLHKTNTGVSCSSTEEIEIALLRYYIEWRAGVLGKNITTEEILRYSSRNRAQELSRIFNGIVNRDI